MKNKPKENLGMILGGVEEESHGVFRSVIVIKSAHGYGDETFLSKRTFQTFDEAKADLEAGLATTCSQIQSEHDWNFERLAVAPDGSMLQ